MASEVDFTRAQIQGVTAELGHPGLEADASARGRLLEDHCQTATLKERCKRSVLIEGLEAYSEVKKTKQL
jgi:hypothetical protein